MPLTKQYLRYVPDGVFGVVAGKQCNAVYLHPKRFIAAGGTNAVLMWDIRLNRKVHSFTCESTAVILLPNVDFTLLAVGHLNGGVSIHDLKDKSEEASKDPNVTFEGHTSEILSLEWDTSGTVLISGGKDTRIIVWDCVAESGIAKLKGHKGPVTRLRTWNNSKHLVSSSTDTTIRIWDMTTHSCVHTLPGNCQIWDFTLWGDYIFVGETNVRLFQVSEDGDDGFKNSEVGQLQRSSSDRVRVMQIVQGKYILVAGARSQQIDLFHLNNPAESERKRKKRLNKYPDGDRQLILSDLVRSGDSCRTFEGKLRSIDAFEEADGTLKILTCLPSNQLEVISCSPKVSLSQEEKEKLKVKKKFDLYGFDGHRKLVRGLAFSADKTAILAASGDAFKLWHRSTLSCVLTVKHEFPVVCCQFCPGDRHFIAGTTCGKLILVDVASGTIIQTEQCGDDTVWGLDMYSNNQGFVASNGQNLNFYDLSMRDGELRFGLQRQVSVEESILCLKVSPNMRFLAVGLLDSTIKVYYWDTMKFHLSLYGHKLPVVGIDISSDNSLLASCSGDKSIKVWGLDFGDCHCSMLHTDGLIGVGFLESTHHLLSVGKDSINYYDGDNHQRIQTIKAHSEGGSTAMAIGGLFIVTSGRDQSLRLFNRTDEILVLDDEREREREEDLENEAVAENPLPSLHTVESEKMADKLIEALDAFKDKSDFNPLLHAYGAKTHNEFMTKVLSTIKGTELEQSLMLLPVSYIHQMIPALAQVLANYPLASELAIKCFSSLVRFHLASLRIADKEILAKVAELAEKRARDLRDTVGFNVAGLKFLEQAKIVESLAEEFSEILGGKRRKRKLREKVIKRALLEVTQ